MANTSEIISRAKKAVFLTELARTGLVTQSAERAKIHYSGLYKHRKEDEEFAEAWNLALEKHAERLEAEADRRGVEGWDEPVFHEGEICGYKRKYSDGLLQFRLKAIKPEKYRERFDYTGETVTKVYLGTSPDENKDGVNLGETPDGA